MNDTGNIEKRIKRHVVGKTQTFFIATLPGIESVCFNELRQLGIPVAEAAISKGGITFNGRLHDCYLANLKLRTANRILMRLFTFTASNFRQLEKKLSNMPWELYLSKDTACELNVTATHSRLIHTDAIADRFKTSIGRQPGTAAAQYAANDAGKSQQIFVRVQDDVFTVSIDSSGELLHKRGVKIQGGRAPVRETMAAAILALAGYQPGEPLIDPMCGSGTFSIEAAMIAKNIPAGWYRKFAFMDWPAFKSARWEHIRREAENKIATTAEPFIFASDTDADTIQKLSRLTQDNHLSDTINVSAADFFELQPQSITPPGLIVLNPPYGRRIGSKNTAEKMFGRIGEKLKNDFNGWKVALLMPDKHLLTKFPFKTTRRDLTHGGLQITLVTGKIR